MGECPGPLLAVPSGSAPTSRFSLAIDKLTVPRSTIPAVTHVDDSARIQTIRQTDTPFFYDVIRAFEADTGCPVIVNTSFNVKDEPIVCTPEDAYRCFTKTQMDVPVIESHVIVQPTTMRSRIDESASVLEAWQ
jgi:carbamoyltransferase